jgi:predicted exporter
MLTAVITRTVAWSIRHAWRVILISVALVIACAAYASRHFAINTDVGGLIDTSAPWAQREAALSKAFPQRSDTTLVVVRAPAPELAVQAARELAARLQQQACSFR